MLPFSLKVVWFVLSLTGGSYFSTSVSVASADTIPQA